MNPIYLHMTTHKRNHHPKMTKTLETNITSEKGDEKSSNITTPLNSNNGPTRKDKNSLYLIQYQKYFNKKLVIKYNILPNEYILMNLENFISAKYCHNLAIFKEMLIYNYDEEFMKRFYRKKDSVKKIPLFSEFYKSYLKFFCFPTLAELKLNDLIEDMVEKKAKAFYNDNYKDENDKDKNQKKINMIFFTNKVRQDISRENSLANLTKTSIKNNSFSNKSSSSLLTVEKLYDELNNEEKVNDNNPLNSKSEDKALSDKNNQKNKNNNLSNNINKINIIINKNCGLKNTVFLHKIKNKINYNDINSNNISNRNSKYLGSATNSNNKKIKNRISRNMEIKVLESKASNSKERSTIPRTKKLKSMQKNIQNILKLNSKGNPYKNIFSQYQNSRRISVDKKGNSRQRLSKRKRIKDIRIKTSINYVNKSNNSIGKKNNILISNINYKDNNIINNNFLKINCNKHYYTNFKVTKTNTTSNNNSNRNIEKKNIKVTKKPSVRKIKKIKSRNYKSIISDTNTIYTTNNEINSKNKSKNENPTNYYFNTNDKILTNFTNKMQTSQNSRRKIKRYIRKENKIKLNYKSNNIPNSINTCNGKIFNYMNSIRKKPAYIITSKTKKSNASLSPSLKNLILKTQGLRKSKPIESKNNAQLNTNSYNLSDSQRIVKNLKVVNAK